MWSDTDEHKCNIKIPHIALLFGNQRKQNLISPFPCMPYAFCVYLCSVI